MTCRLPTRWLALAVAWLCLLAQAPAAGPQTAQDQFGDPLPDGALLRIGTTRNRSSGVAQALAFSSDGKRLVTIDLGTGVHVWDAAAGRELAAFGGLASGLAPFAVSADGSLAALVAAHDVCRVYDTATGRVIQAVHAPWTQARVLAFSPDKKLLCSLGEDQVVRVWEVATGALLRRWEQNSESDWRSLRIAFAPDGKTLAMGARNTPIYLRDIASGKQSTLGTIGECGGGLAFAANGKILAAIKTHGQFFNLWDVAAGKVLHAFAAEQAPFWCAGFTPDSQTVATAHYPGKLCFWDTATGKLQRTFTGHPGEIENLTFSADGKRLALGSGGCTVRIWDAATARQQHVFTGHHATLVAARFTSDGKSIAAISSPWYFLKTPGGSTLRHFDAVTGLVRAHAEWNPETTSAAGLSTDGNVLAVAGPGAKIVVTDVANGQAPKVLVSAGWPVKGLRLTAQGRYLAVETVKRPTEPSVLESGLIQVWDVPAAKEAFSITGMPGQEFFTRFTDDGRLLAVLARRYQYIDSGEIFRTNVVLGPVVNTLAFWDIRGGSKALRAGLPTAIDSLGTLSPSGRLAASRQATGEQVVIRELITGNAVLSLGVGGQCSALAFSPDGRTMALGTQEGRIVLWDFLLQTNLTALAGHSGSVTSVSFSRDGKRLVSAGADTTLVVWDVARWTSRELKQVPLRPGEAAKCWQDMAVYDAANAYAGVLHLVRSPKDAVAFLGQQLRPVQAEDTKEIAPAIAALDSSRYADREQAMLKLQKLGALAVPALEKVLADRPTLEMRRRAELLLARVEAMALRPEWLQAWRAIELLEMLGTPEAVTLLESLAGGVPDAWLTQEAEAALERVRKRVGP